LTDEDLQTLQVILMTHPKNGDVIEGTGGLRKLRFAPKNWPTGKSGALRICSAYFEEVGTIVLGIVYKKSEMDDLSNEVKEILSAAIDRIKISLLSHSYRCGEKKRAEER